MEHPITGRAWKFGDNVDTGQMAIGQYTRQGVEVYSAHCLENLRPEFPTEVRPRDIVVAGKNFGSGSSRETAVLALRYLEVGAVVAEFFSRLFFRNAINLGLPVVECSNTAQINDGDLIELYPVQGRIVNISQENSYQVQTLPDHLMKIIQAGGLVPYLEQNYLTS
ncbi:MAG: 3-isopropylmalate dehydratase [Actinomycetota bacterium]|nr:MAG: 3-isopropylmalate dehydratase [Actinomycetota bacterium]